MCTVKRWHLNRVVPKLKQACDAILYTIVSLDLKDTMKLFSENLMKSMITGKVSEINKVGRAMEFIPKRKKLIAVIDELDKKYTPHKLALLKICLDLREAFYRTCKPLLNMRNLFNILLTQLKVAEILKEGCNIEVILYMKTMTKKDLYFKLDLFQYKDSFNRTLNQAFEHYNCLAQQTKLLLNKVKKTQYYE